MNRSIRVLLVEDSTAQRLYVKSLLTGRSDVAIEVIEAKEGAHGLALASEKSPDVVLCDVDMPVIDGIGFVSRLRQNTELSNIPVIMITSSGDRIAMRRAMGAGADDYLTKPFTRDELFDAIAGQIAKSGRQTEMIRNSLDGLRESLLSCLPHELRTPLTSIVSGAELLIQRGEAMGEKKRQDVLEVISRGGRRLMRTVSRYLELIEIRSRTRLPKMDFISLDKGWLETVLKDPLGQQIMGLTAEGAPLPKERDYSSSLEMDIEPALVVMNQKDFVRVIYELVGNCLKFARPGTLPRISGVSHGETYWLSIENFGPELPLGYSALLGEFMQFSRDSNEQQGLGLGLPIAASLLEQNQTSMEWVATNGEPNIVRVRLSRK